MAKEITLPQLVSFARRLAECRSVHLCAHDISAVGEMLSYFDDRAGRLHRETETLTRQLDSAHSQITQLALEIDALKNPSKTKQRLADLEARVAALESI